MFYLRWAVRDQKPGSNEAQRKLALGYIRALNFVSIFFYKRCMAKIKQYQCLIGKALLFINLNLLKAYIKKDNLYNSSGICVMHISTTPVLGSLLKNFVWQIVTSTYIV